jgi:LacI family transcriptional regulator
MNDQFQISDFKKLNAPIFVTPSNKKVSEACNIIADDFKLGKLGAIYFINKGFKNLAFYGNDKIFWSYDRKISFQETVLSKGLKCFSAESLLNDGWQRNPQQLIPWLKQLPKPVAIMTCSDEFSIHIIKAARMADLKIPEEVAILGVDNDEFICNLYDPPISSIDQEPENVGFKVAQVIRSFIINGTEIPKEIMGVNFNIVTRRSSDIFAVEDDQLKIALEFIQRFAGTRKLTVDEIVRETTLSRRLLEIRFRKILNRSILQEISRVRINLICKEITQTNKPMNEIAYNMGFNSVSSFSSFFKKEMNISPIEYRKNFKIN